MKLSKNNTKILNSYLLKRKEVKSIVKNVILNRRAFNFPITRTEKSYIRELKAHILLYKLHLFRSHTKDTDLEEPIKKRNEIIYFFIGR